MKVTPSKAAALGATANNDRVTVGQTHAVQLHVTDADDAQLGSSFCNDGGQRRTLSRLKGDPAQSGSLIYSMPAFGLAATGTQGRAAGPEVPTEEGERRDTSHGNSSIVRGL